MEELSHQLLNHRFLKHNRLLLIQAAATILMHTALPHVELMSSDTFPEVKHQNAKALNLSFYGSRCRPADLFFGAPISNTTSDTAKCMSSYCFHAGTVEFTNCANVTHKTWFFMTSVRIPSLSFTQSARPDSHQWARTRSLGEDENIPFPEPPAGPEPRGRHVLSA